MKKKTVKKARSAKSTTSKKQRSLFANISIGKFRFSSAIVLGCLVLLAGGVFAYTKVNNTAVLGTYDTQYRNCYVIRSQNGKLSAQLGESKHGKSSEGIYRYGSTTQQQQCTVSYTDTFSHNVPSVKPIYIKFVSSSGKDLPFNFFATKPSVTIYMKVAQMPEGNSNGIVGSGYSHVSANGKLTMYQYGSTKTIPNGNEWSLPCADGVTPCFAENKVTFSAIYDHSYYRIYPYGNSSGLTITTYVSPLLDQYWYGDINHTICGNRAGNECKFAVTVIKKPQSEPTTCTSAKGYCTTLQYCRGVQGTQIKVAGCSTGQICCKEQ